MKLKFTIVKHLKLTYIMADTMMRFSNSGLNEFLTMEQLKELCPSAFKTAPTNPKVTDKYVMANTATVIEDLNKLGWKPVAAKQCRGKKNSSGIRSFHMIAFQNPDVKISKLGKDGSEVIDAWPQIILTNSHDGFNSFKFMVGLFRLVCSNGLVVSDSNLANMSIKHINYTFETLREIVTKTIEQIPEIVCTMNLMKTIELSDEEKKEIASEVVKIRKNVDTEQKIDIDEKTIMDILEPVRSEDDSNDLWTVFNVCQEKMIKGGFNSVGNRNKTRKQRGITSIKKNIDYNQRLWDFSMRYIPATVEA